jgi:hypothetical protein
LALVVALLATSGLAVWAIIDSSKGDLKDPERFSTGSALVSLDAEAGVENSYRIHLRAGDIAIFTIGTFRAEKPVRILRGSPVQLPSEVEVLAMRVNELESVNGGPVTYPGLLCTRRWPPHGFGPTQALEDFDLDEGDRFAITAWLRLAAPGDARVDSLEVLYEDGDDAYRQTFDGSLLRMSVTAPDETPEGALCDPNSGDPWDQPT